jgi:hypothetical protein
MLILADLNENEFKKANVYNGLSPDQHGDALPEAVNLLKFAPSRSNQGKQGSCVAWSSAYAARSIVEAVRQGKDGNNFKFSPSYLYNQIKLGGDCQGSYILRAMEAMTKNGAVEWDKFPYNEDDCTRMPAGSLMQEGSQYRINGYARLTEDGNPKNLSLNAVKEHLSRNAPVVIGMMVGQSFMQGMMGESEWVPSRSDFSMQGFGGHAMCAIGYDNSRFGGKGGFLIMNSWGPEWGNNGVAWVSYPDFKYFVREAYGIEPLPKMGAAANVALNVQIGLYAKDAKQYIPLSNKGGNVFSSVNKVGDGTKLKIEMKNNDDCYAYMIGFENDGRANVLFPTPDSSNTSKSIFSPFCGITGYRLFPRGANLVPTGGGGKDVFALIITKKPIDAFALRNGVNTNRSGDFSNRLKNVLANMGGASGTASYGNGATAGTINMSSGAGDGGAMVSIIEINK